MWTDTSVCLHSFGHQIQFLAGLAKTDFPHWTRRVRGLSAETKKGE